MRFLITLNMPSANGFLVHQIIFDHHDETMTLFLDRLNEDIFIYGRQFYKRVNEQTGEGFFLDKGELILNTAHIGKVQEFIDYDGETETNRQPRQRPPIRGSRAGY